MLGEQIIPMRPNLRKHNLAKSIFSLLCIICLLMFLPTLGDAHRVNLFAWIEGDTVYVESKFSGGRHVNAGKITILDSKGGELLSGMTNEKGEFSFKLPKKTDLTIVLDAGEGHRAEWKISAAEIEMPASKRRSASDNGIPAKNILLGSGCIFAMAAVGAIVRKRKLKKTNHEGTKN